MMIGGIVLGALLLAAAPSAKEREQAARQAAIMADAACAVAFSTESVTRKTYSKEQMDRGWLFFVGRMLGRHGTWDEWGVILEDASLAMKPGEAAALVERCAAEMYKGGIPL